MSSGCKAENLGANFDLTIDREISDMTYNQEVANHDGRVFEPEDLSFSRVLQTAWSKVLSIPVEEVDLDASFMLLGGDSFKAVSVYQICLDQGISISIGDILLRKSITQIAQEAQTDDSSDEESPQPEDDIASDQTCSPTDTSVSRNSFSWKLSKYTVAETLSVSELERLADEMRSCGISSQAQVLDAIESLYPCSPMQENMFIGEHTQHRQVYRTAILIEARVRCDLHVAVEMLKKAWQQVVDQHEILRTLYVQNLELLGGHLIHALVLKYFQATIEVKNFRDAAEVHEEYRLSRISAFPFEKGPPHKMTIFTTSNGQLFCNLSQSHLITDGSSLHTIMDQLTSFYDEKSTQKFTQGYSHYIQYLTTLNSSGTKNEALKYWAGYLDGVEVCQFPGSSPDEQAHGAVAYSELIDVPFSNLESIKIQCKQLDISVSSFLQAAWAIVLQCYTGDAEVCFGYITSGRSLPIPGVESIVGPLINLLACRVRLDKGRSTRSILKNIQDDIARSLPFQHTPLAQIQRALGISGTSLFNTIVSSHFSSKVLRDDKNTSLNLVYTHNATEFDVVVKIMITEVDLRICLSYSTAKISPLHASRVAQTFCTVLESLTRLDDLDLPVDEVDFLSTQDKIQIQNWNAKTIKTDPVSSDSCVHWIIDEVTKRQPHDLAISAWDGQMSFETLDYLATNLAHRILQLGLPSNSFIPLCFEKSKWFTVALLSVMKSGFAFVPLDPSHPTMRIQHMLNQLRTSSSVVLCSKGQYPRFSSLGMAVIVADDSSIIPFSGHDMFLPLPKTLPSDPVYAIFTSGSTGVPKAVVIEHKAYSFAIKKHRAGLHIGRTSRVLQFASYSFDTAIEDHLTTLAVGACLCVPSEDERLGELVPFINRTRVNWAHLTPTMARTFTPEQVPLLTTMVLGGEQMTKNIVKIWSIPGRRLIQVYGPSEACVTSTINPEITLELMASNIGRAFEGCASWVVRSEDHNTLCPIGAVGELAMEGTILAKEYLGNPNQTSLSFINDPTWGLGKRIYKTGDLVRYYSDGNLEFVGRKDGQIKIRGQRLEPGEIEESLSLEETVLYSVVLSPKSGLCAGKLVCVLSLRFNHNDELSVPRENHTDIHLYEGSVSTHFNKLSENLSNRLPSYMIPDMWVFLKTIPKNTSGKLDRKRISRYLEDLDEDTHRWILHATNENIVERLGTSFEIAFRDVWSEVLNIQPSEISWHSSLYSLGGDSISAMTISSRSRRKGLLVTAADILRHKNIERIIQNMQVMKRSPNNLQNYITDKPEPWSLSPMQQLHFQSSPAGDNYDQQTMILSLKKRVSYERIREGFELLIAAHPMLRAEFKPVSSNILNDDDPIISGKWVQCITNDLKNRVNLRTHESLNSSYMSATIFEARASLRILNGPIMAVDIFQTNLESVISITVHHLVVDIVSWGIILQDLEDFFELNQHPATENFTFESWCKAQVDYSRMILYPSNVLSRKVPIPAADLNFWGMEGIPNCFGDIVVQEFSLTAEITSKLLGICNERFTSEPVDLFIAATMLSYANTFNRDPPPVFNEGHGRELFDTSIDLSRTVGWFTTLAPVLVGRPSTTTDAIRKVKDWRRQMPLKGLSYFASRFLNEDGMKEFRKDNWPMEIILNYLGNRHQLQHQDAFFKKYNPSWSSTTLHSQRLEQRSSSERYSLISILASVEGGRLFIKVEWNKQMLYQENIQNWIAGIKTTLVAITSELGVPGHTEATLCDFPLLSGLNYSSLDYLMNSTLPALGICSKEVENLYACSPLQESLILSQLKNETAAYNQHFLLKILPSCGLVDCKRLADSWTKVLYKHAVLRTVFVEVDMDEIFFIQVVLRKFETLVELQTMKDESAVIDQWARDEKQPGQSPLSGKALHFIKICRTMNGDTFVLLSKHHILTDGKSSQLLIQDLLDAYDDCLGSIGATYADYIAFTGQQDPSIHIQYWTNYLQNVSPCIFPALQWKVGSDSSKFRISNLQAVPINKRRINSFCQENDVSPSNIFQAAWALVLRSYLQAEDICFGFLASGRDQQVEGIDEIVGPVANLMAFKRSISSQTIVLDIVKNFQEDYINHLPKQNVSRARVLRALKSGPLFNTILNIQKKTVKSPRVLKPNSTKAQLLKASDKSEYGIAIAISETEHSFEIDFEYSKALFDEGQAYSIMSTFETAIYEIISQPQTQVKDVCLLNQTELLRIQKWNSVAPKTVERCVHDLVKEIVHRQPQRPAICSWDGDLSYYELDLLATKLAWSLVENEVKPEQIVVLCFEKSLWAVVAMLATIKAGGCFVHIDPNAPLLRAQNLVAQTGAEIGLCSQECYHKMTQLVPLALVVNTASVDILPLPRTEKISAVKPSNAMYTIFTSGSTGLPKGVVIEYQSYVLAIEGYKFGYYMVGY